MRGASRTSLAQAREQLAAAVEGGAAPGRLGEQLFAVMHLLDTSAAVRRAMTDPSRPQQAKTDLAAALLTGKISPAAVQLVSGAARRRWSAPGDLPDAIEQLAVIALVIAAEQAGQLDELEDELFRFSRVVSSNPSLRLALSNPFLAAQRKQDVLDALLGSRATEQTQRLVGQAAIYPRGRSLDASLEEYARLAAERRERLVAQVHVAIALTARQRGRLAAALAAVYGHDVHLNIVIDPQVVGGMSIRIGDEQIDGSIATRLAGLRRRLAA